MAFLTLDNAALEGKCVFCRIDLNCPLDEKTKNPQLSPRITAHARTVLDLASMGARVVLLAHQGRKGDDDFTSLAPHAKLLEKEVKKLAKVDGKKSPRVIFVDDVCGEKAKTAIRSLKNGEVVLLQNVRYLDDETKYEKNGGKSELVKNLSSFCDVFVLDAFSCAHRAHASVVGFSSLPCLAGRVMAEELGALEKFRNPPRPVVFVLGGAKPDDSLPILKAWLDAGKLDYALCGGLLGSLMLLAAGHELGATKGLLEKKEALAKLDDAKALLSKYSSKIVIPADVIVDADGAPSVLDAGQLPSPHSISDIGPKTSQHFSSLIRSAGSIVMNGPMGVYEKNEFAGGTKQVLEAIASSSAFSLLGGGHTLSALDKFKINKSRLGYVSLSGKALIEYLSGEKLPGVEMLEKAVKKPAKLKE
ncbi:MAG: phosphoglycerate kinase [Candidatus Marsarchaeota archaeon]|nr:phosphoglycerate kinase [Candidatus Marsarchaeota archaeon]